VQQLPTEL
jgi:hypothetical protein